MTLEIVTYTIAILAFFLLLQGWASLRAAKEAEARTEPGETLRRRTLADGLSPWLIDLVTFKVIRNFENLIATSGVGISANFALLLMEVLTTVIIVASAFAGLGLWSVAIGLLLGGALPVSVLTTLRKRRFSRIGQQLPEALDMLVRSLRAGHPVPMGIKMIAHEMQEPIGGEFMRVHEAMSYGLNLREALEAMARRLHIAEVNYMVSAIRIQYWSGGNLSEVLATLAIVIRERKKLRMKVSALSAESRLSGHILAALPFVVAIAINWINKDFYKDVPNHPAQIYVLAFAGFLVLVGIVLVRRIVNIRV